MALVDALCINSIQLTHAQGKIALRRLNYQAVVIVPQTVGVAQPIEARHNLTQTDQIHLWLEQGNEWVNGLAC